MASAEHSPSPGAISVVVVPSATSVSARSRAGSLGKPIDTNTSPRRSRAATSASSASAARSTASRAAVRSSDADETVARKPVSCWVDQFAGESPKGAEDLDQHERTQPSLEALAAKLLFLGSWGEARRTNRATITSTSVNDCSAIISTPPTFWSSTGDSPQMRGVCS